MATIDDHVKETKAKIAVIINSYTLAHKYDKSHQLIEKFKKEVAHAVVSGIVHNCLGMVDSDALTKISLEVTNEAGEEFEKRIIND